MRNFLYCSPLNFLPGASPKIRLNYFQLFRWKPWKRKQTKTLSMQFQWFIFYKPACLQRYFRARALSIRVFSSDGHYGLIVGTFRSDYEYEYEFFNLYPVRMPDCVRLSRQLVLSSKSRRRLDAKYEIFKKSRPPSTSSLQVQRWVKRLVFKSADTLWNVPCNLSRNVLATLWHLVLFVY